MNIIQGFPNPQKDQYKVYARSFTYNQAPYIEDCLNGVAMQQTDFPFVHHVVDDCSTDGEQEVIKAWIEKNCDLDTAEYYDNDICTITMAKAKNNPNYTLAAYFLKKNMYGNPKKMELVTPWREVCPYEALCEGDDYWVDPKKLQKQVDFMESHPKCTWVLTGRYVDDERTGRRVQQTYRDRIYTTHDILSGFNPGLQNALYVTEITKRPYIKGINGDRQYPYFASLIGEIRVINDITSVYRVTGKGVSTSVSKEKWFEHATNDFINFHKITQSHDKSAILKGLSNYVGPYIRKEGVGGVYRSYKFIKEYYNTFAIYSYLRILGFTLLRKIKVLNYSDRKEHIVY